MSSRLIITMICLILMTSQCTSNDVKRYKRSEAFDDLVTRLPSTHRDGLDLSSVGRILNALNEHCLTSEKLFNYLHISRNSSITEDIFCNASILINYFAAHQQHCEDSFNDKQVDNVIRNAILSGSFVCRNNFDHLLPNHQQKHKRDTTTTTQHRHQRCFSPADILETKCSNNEHQITGAFATIFTNLLDGKCILPHPHDFIQNIFLNCGKTNKILLNKDLRKLVEKLQRKLPQRRIKPKSLGQKMQCFEKNYTMNELLKISANKYNFTNDENFIEMCPAIIIQLIKSRWDETNRINLIIDEEYTLIKKYAYASVVLIIVTTLVSAGLFFFKENKVQNNGASYATQFFVALSVGTLSGDAIIHVLPKVIKPQITHHHHLHHNIGGGDHDEIWKMMAVISGIYLCYLFESFTKLYFQLRSANEDLRVEKKEKNKIVQLSSYCVTVCEVIKSNDEDENQINNKSMKPYTQQTTKHSNDHVFWGMTEVEVMVLFGDILHNFGDGIALGAAFSIDWISGVGTAIALFCQELPHEFGGFTIYLKHGMSKTKAILLNLLADIFAFIGLYIGINIAEHGQCPIWLLAIITGIFIYLSLVDLTQQTLDNCHVADEKAICFFFIHHFGLLSGWLLLIIVALYEHELMTLCNMFLP